MAGGGRGEAGTRPLLRTSKAFRKSPDFGDEKIR